MASIRKRVSKAGVESWAVLYTQDKRQRSTTFDNEKDAIAFRDVANAVSVEAANQLLIAKADYRTVDSLFMDWLQLKKADLTTEGHRDYERAYAKWIKPHFGWRDAEMVTERDVQGWVDNTLKPKLGAKAVAKQHALLHGMYRWASSKTVGLIENDPCTETKLPKRKRRPPRGLTIPELDKMLDAAAVSTLRDAGDVIAVMAGTGWRPGEVMGLRAGAVEVMANGHVYATMLSVYRRGEGIVEDGKTEAAGRRLRVLGEGATVLASRIIGKGINDPVFPNPNPRTKKGEAAGVKPWPPASFTRSYWPKIVEAAGLTERAPTPYSLRHTHVAICHAAGLTMPEIQRRIGHESIQTTIDVYGKLIDGMSPDSADRLDAILMRRDVVKGEVVSAPPATLTP